MTALEILSAIKHAGGDWSVVNGSIHIQAPHGLLTQDHKATLSAAKNTLIRLLSPDADPERAAILWVESLSPEEGAIVLDRARREWEQFVRDNDPEYNLHAWAEKQIGCEQSELSEQSDTVRTDHILAIGADADRTWSEAEPPGAPCTTCGDLAAGRIVVAGRLRIN